MYQDLLKDPKLKPVADALVQQFKSENPISQIKTLIRAFCANGYADKTREVDFNTPEEAALTMLEVCSETEYNLNENYYARVEALDKLFEDCFKQLYTETFVEDFKGVK